MQHTFHLYSSSGRGIPFSMIVKYILNADICDLFFLILRSWNSSNVSIKYVMAPVQAVGIIPFSSLHVQYQTHCIFKLETLCYQYSKGIEHLELQQDCSSCALPVVGDTENDGKKPLRQKICKRLEGYSFHQFR